MGSPSYTMIISEGSELGRHLESCDIWFLIIDLDKLFQISNIDSQT